MIKKYNILNSFFIKYLLHFIKLKSFLNNRNIHQSFLNFLNLYINSYLYIDPKHVLKLIYFKKNIFNIIVLQSFFYIYIKTIFSLWTSLNSKKSLSIVKYPLKKRNFTILKSPFKHKKARDQFELLYFKYIIKTSYFEKNNKIKLDKFLFEIMLNTNIKLKISKYAKF
jgi:ribosomal protein S10